MNSKSWKQELADSLGITRRQLQKLGSERMRDMNPEARQVLANFALKEVGGTKGGLAARGFRPCPKGQPVRRTNQVHVRIYRDGRETCETTLEGRREYKRRIKLMWQRQDGLCALCGAWLDATEATFGHGRSRGFGGSSGGGGFRDDRIEIDGVWVGAALHGSCNSLQSSRHYVWHEGKYIYSKEAV